MIAAERAQPVGDAALILRQRFGPVGNRRRGNVNGLVETAGLDC